MTTFNIKRLFWKWWYKYHSSPSRYTSTEAIEIASKHKLKEEIMTALKYGLTPDEALQEWDIYPYDNAKD